MHAADGDGEWWRGMLPLAYGQQEHPVWECGHAHRILILQSHTFTMIQAGKQTGNRCTSGLFRTPSLAEGEDEQGGVEIV